MTWANFQPVSMAGIKRKQGLSSYMGKARLEKMKEEGLVFCPKHPTIFYNAKKFKQCFYCFREQPAHEKI